MCGYIGNYAQSPLGVGVYSTVGSTEKNVVEQEPTESSSIIGEATGDQIAMETNKCIESAFLYFVFWGREEKDNNILNGNLQDFLWGGIVGE